MALETKIQMKLLQPHEHAGVRYNQYEVISVSPNDANILINMGVAEKHFEKDAKSSSDKRDD